MISRFDSTLARITASFALLIAISASQFINAGAHSGNRSSEVPSLPDFASSFEKSEGNRLRGLYVDGVMADLVVQQPKNSPNFISSQKNVLTQFSLAGQSGGIGLLAHNNLAGGNFESLHIGEVITLVYGGNRIETYIVSKTYRYQALIPNSGHSRLKDLSTQLIYRAADVFNMMYGNADQVTLQTRIAKDGDPNWGRLFIIAKRMIERPIPERQIQNLYSK